MADDREDNIDYDAYIKNSGLVESDSDSDPKTNNNTNMYEMDSESEDDMVSDINNGKMVVKIVKPKKPKQTRRQSKTINKLTKSNQEEPEQNIEHVEEKIAEKGANSLPKSWERNLVKVNKIADFVEQNNLDCILDPNYQNPGFDQYELKELKSIVKSLNRICQDIDNIDNGLIKARDIRNPATIMSYLINLANKYVEL